LPVHTIAAQLYFSLSFISLEMPPGLGHFVADISDTLDMKMASIRCYQTQFPPEKAQVFDRAMSIAHHYGTAAGFRAGELFSSPRTLGASDVMKLVFR